MKSLLLRVRRRFWLPVFAAAFLVGGSAMSLRFASADPAPRESESPSHATRWVATWGAGAQNIGFVFGGITIRNIMFTSVGGSEVRVRFTNAFGDQPLEIGQAAIGLAGAGSSIDGPNAAVTFFGQRSVTIPPGAEVLSDPVRLDVPALSDLAITEYLPQGDNQNGSGHSDAQQTSYFTFGNYTSDTGGAPINAPVGSWYYIDGVDVVPNRPVEGAVVAIGDSITDGFRSTVDANRRWPNDLARRLEARAGSSLGVTDAGISGNELLQDRSPGGANQNAVARFDRDVLDRAGVRDVILLEGVNDIEVASATAAEIIAGYEQIISQAHDRGCGSSWARSLRADARAHRRPRASWSINGSSPAARSTARSISPRRSRIRPTRPGSIPPTTVAITFTRTTPATRRCPTPPTCPTSSTTTSNPDNQIRTAHAITHRTNHQDPGDHRQCFARDRSRPARPDR